MEFSSEFVSVSGVDETNDSPRPAQHSPRPALVLVSLKLNN